MSLSVSFNSPTDYLLLTAQILEAAKNTFFSSLSPLTDPEEFLSAQKNFIYSYIDSGQYDEAFALTRPENFGVCEEELSSYRAFFPPSLICDLIKDLFSKDPPQIEGAKKLATFESSRRSESFYYTTSQKRMYEFSQIDKPLSDFIELCIEKEFFEDAKEALPLLKNNELVENYEELIRLS